MVLLGLRIIYQGSLTWQVNEVKIARRDILGRETSLCWVDLQRIRSRSNSVVRLEIFDGAHIDLPAGLPGFSEVLETARSKRADLWRPDAPDRVWSNGNGYLVLLLIFTLGTIGAAVYLIFQPFGFPQLCAALLIAPLMLELFYLFYYPYRYDLGDGILHLKYWPARERQFRPADVSDVLMQNIRTRNGVIITVSIRTQKGKIIRLPRGGVYLYGVLKQWKDAG